MINDFQIVTLAAKHHGDGVFEVEAPRDGSFVKVKLGIDSLRSYPLASLYALITSVYLGWRLSFPSCSSLFHVDID